MTAPEVFYLSHGGGPLPLLGDPGHREMVECLKAVPSRLARPDAILVVSAHWESDVPVVTAGPQPGLIYDYYGFPEESYEIAYPAPGHPELAGQVHDVLQSAGIESRLDIQRGFDHGLFVPLKLMYPEADIPCVQLSLVNHLDPELHLKIGEALRNLQFENLLVIGSGFSFHNMKAFFDGKGEGIENIGFDEWLTETVSGELSETERRDRLVHWSAAPGARFCHPREEHLIPLHVCYGVVGRKSDDTMHLSILDKKASMYLWQS